MTRLEEEIALMDIVSNLKAENAQLKKALELLALKATRIDCDYCPSKARSNCKKGVLDCRDVLRDWAMNEAKK